MAIHDDWMIWRVPPWLGLSALWAQVKARQESSTTSGAEDGGCHAWGIPRIVNGLYPQLYVEYPLIYIYIHTYIHTHIHTYIYMGYKPLTKWHAHPCGLDEFRESICPRLTTAGHIPLCSQSKHLYFCSLYLAKCPCLFDPQMSLMTQIND